MAIDDPMEMIPLDLYIRGEWDADGLNYRIVVRRLTTGYTMTCVLTEMLVHDAPDAAKYAVENAIESICFGHPDYMRVVAMIPSPPPREPFTINEPTICRLKDGFQYSLFEEKPVADHP